MISTRAEPNVSCAVTLHWRDEYKGMARFVHAFMRYFSRIRNGFPRAHSRAPSSATLYALVLVFASPELVGLRPRLLAPGFPPFC